PDPAWLTARDESERDGQLLSNISSPLLSPTAFSAVK
ncbi:NIPSNAP family protein, partial [Rhizobium leguminosarum]